MACRNLKCRPTIVLFLISLILSCYYYYCLNNTYIPFHSDDAGSVFALFDDFNFGGQSYLHGSVSIFSVLLRITCHFFGYSKFSTMIVFSVQFFVMFFLSGLLVTKKFGHIFPVIFLSFFSGMLGTYGAAEIQISKFHTGPTIIFLLILLVMESKLTVMLRNIMIGVLLIFSLMQDDGILSICVCILPVLFVYTKKMWSSYKFRRLAAKIVTVLIFIFFIVNAGLNLIFQVSGNALINGPMIQYGNRTFSDFEMIIANVSVFLKGLFGMFNCQIYGDISIFSFEFIFNFFKAVIVITSLVFAFYSFFRICRNKGSYGDSIIAISAQVVFVTIAYLMTGEQQDAISMRYCQSFLFLLPIFLTYLIRDFEFNFNIKKYYIPAAFIMFCGIFAQFEFINPNAVVYDYSQLTEALLKEDVKYAVAPYWAAGVVNVLSEESILVQPCSITNEELQRSEITVLSLFDDRNITFDTIISSNYRNASYDETSFGMQDEKITKIYGQPDKKIWVNNEQCLYRYNYDIRISPQVINASQFIDADIKEEIGGALVDRKEQPLYLFEQNMLGTYILEAQGINIENGIQLKFNEDIQVEIVQEIVQGDKLIVKINLPQMVDKLMVYSYNETGKEAYIKLLKLKSVKEAVDFVFSDLDPCKNRTFGPKVLEADPLPVRKGKYQLIVRGENINNIQLATNEGVAIKEVVTANQRNVYEIDVNKDMFLKLFVQTEKNERLKSVSLVLKK